MCKGLGLLGQPLALDRDSVTQEGPRHRSWRVVPRLRQTSPEIICASHSICVVPVERLRGAAVLVLWSVVLR